MPNRVIRDAILDSDRYHDLAHDSERLLFLELLLLADDFGLVPLNHGFLRRRTTPCAGRTLAQITAMISALADRDLVRCYTSERGGKFGFIPRFGNSPRALKPKWPVPPESLGFGKKIRDLDEKRGTDDTQSFTNEPVTETVTETEKKKTTAMVICSSGSDDPDQQSLIEGETKTLVRQKAVPDCPVNELVALYHTILPELPQVVAVSSARRQALVARWREVCVEDSLDRAGGLEFFRSYFTRIRSSKFLMGKAPAAPGRTAFRCSFDFVIRQSSFLKIIEGAYS